MVPSELSRLNCSYMFSESLRCVFLLLPAVALRVPRFFGLYITIEGLLSYLKQFRLNDQKDAADDGSLGKIVLNCKVPVARCVRVL